MQGIKALIDRLLPGQNAADVICKLRGIVHQAAVACRRHGGVGRHKGGDARLHPREVVVGLRRPDHDPRDAHRMDRHAGRGRNEAAARRDRERDPDGVAPAQHQRSRGLSHPGDHLRNGKARLHIAAGGIEQDEQGCDLRRFLNGRDGGQQVLILCGLHIVRQDLMPLDLPDDSQAVNAPLPYLSGLAYFFQLHHLPSIVAGSAMELYKSRAGPCGPPCSIL